MTALYDSAAASSAAYRDVEPRQVFSRAGSVRVVDVREPSEYVGELGHIRGAELVPLGMLGTVAKHWEREEEIVLVCRSGRRSAEAAATLTAAGFRRAMNMRGGMLAWKEAELPVEREVLR